MRLVEQVSIQELARDMVQLRARLQASGEPVSLTVEGEPALVIQDAGAYHRLLEVVERAEAIVAIKEGLDAHEAGRVIPFEQFDREMREILGMQPRAA